LVVFCEKTFVFAVKGDDASSIGKENVTFSDMIACVQHDLWIEGIFQPVPGGTVDQRLSLPLRRTLDFGHVQAA